MTRTLTGAPVTRETAAPSGIARLGRAIRSVEEMDAAWSAISDDLASDADGSGCNQCGLGSGCEGVGAIGLHCQECRRPFGDADVVEAEHDAEFGPVMARIAFECPCGSRDELVYESPGQQVTTPEELAWGRNQGRRRM